MVCENVVGLSFLWFQGKVSWLSTPLSCLQRLHQLVQHWGGLTSIQLDFKGRQWKYRGQTDWGKPGWSAVLSFCCCCWASSRWDAQLLWATVTTWWNRSLSAVKRWDLEILGLTVMPVSQMKCFVFTTSTALSLLVLKILRVPHSRLCCMYFMLCLRLAIFCKRKVKLCWERKARPVILSYLYFSTNMVPVLAPDWCLFWNWPYVLI